MTEKSKIIHEPPLRQYAGWSPRSQMHLKYLHYFGNEANESLLQAYGVVTKDQEQSNGLHYKQCPNCNEPNKSDSKFCAKCKMVLTYNAYTETLEKEQRRESEIRDLKDKLDAVHEEQNQKFNQIMRMIQHNPKLANIKPEALVSKVH